jgi:hypothetical protein
VGHGGHAYNTDNMGLPQSGSKVLSNYSPKPSSHLFPEGKHRFLREKWPQLKDTAGETGE